MFRLILQRQASTLLVTLAVVLFVAFGLGVVLTIPRGGSAQALGDPNAPRPTVAAPTVGAAQPPIARPAAAPVDPRPPGRPDPSMRRPDVAMHPAAIAAVQCALGAAPPTHDPTLDEAALAIARAGVAADSVDAMIAAERAVAAEYNLVVWGVLGGFAAVHAPDADPCRFAGKDMRAALTHPDWASVRAVGVAFFAEPSAGAPVSELIIVGR